MIETGDNIVIVAPVWPNIFHAAQVAGADVGLVRLDEDWQAGRWRLDLDKLFDRCDARTKAIFLSSPNNPTGWTASREEQQVLLDFARRRGIAIISDEVYGTLIYDGRCHAPSFLEIADDNDPVFVINSFSKPWAMTGWRIGWLTHPLNLAEAMRILSPCFNTGTATFNQYGALAALTPEGDGFRETLRRRCAANRALVADFIAHQNRLRWIEPDGAFYGFLEIEGLTDSLAFAKDLVDPRQCRDRARFRLRSRRSARRSLCPHLLRPRRGRAGRGPEADRNAANRLNGVHRHNPGNRGDGAAQIGGDGMALGKRDLHLLARPARHHETHQPFAGLHQFGGDGRKRRG